MRTKYRDINGIRHEWCEDTKHYYLAESDGWTNYAGRRTCPECEARGSAAAGIWNAFMGRNR